jgi:hypothetical protein
MADKKKRTLDSFFAPAIKKARTSELVGFATSSNSQDTIQNVVSLGACIR